jgi:hypothetical protein
MLLILIPWALSLQCDTPFEIDVSQARTEPYADRSLANTNMRILLKYIGWSYKTANAVGDALKNINLQVMSFVSKLLTVAVQEKIAITSSFCGDITLPTTEVNKMQDADLVIYVRTIDSGDNYANALPCSMRETSPKRALFGRIAWNTAKVNDYVLQPYGYQVNIRVMLH